MLLITEINQGVKVSLKRVKKDYDLKDMIASEPVVISPYATFWAKGDYYIIAKTEDDKNLTHFNVSDVTEIKLIEQPIDMYFGGVNPQEYAKNYIINKGEYIKNYELEISPDLWEEFVKTFGDRISVKGNNRKSIKVKINTIHTKVFEYVTKHLDKCIAVAPNEFKKKKKKYVYDAYNKYW